MTGSESAPQRLALVVATSTYDDGGLAQLVSPAQDAVALAGVLAMPAIGGFVVSSVVDATSGEICQQIEDFAAERDRGDLLLLYLSCHGLKDEQGRLYFAARNTRRDRLRSTAVPAGFVNDILFACRSRRKVLLLDCCYSGAFAKGMAVKAGPSVHTPDHFDARGLVVLTASDATQYAFEGDALTGRAAPSIFTASVTYGLKTGAADVDGDGLVSVDDVYEYARRQLSEQPRPQSPRKWEFDVAGRIVLARSPAATGTAATAPAVSPREELPMVLPAGRVPVAPAAASARIRQGQWWLGVVLFIATSAALSVLLAWWVRNWLSFSVSADYLPNANIALLAGLGGAGWAFAYAAVDATQTTPPHWYDLHRRWLATLGEVFRPAGAGQFLRAANAAVPLNVALTLLASLEAAALGYAYAGGSEGRDKIFPVAYILLTVLAVAAHLASLKRRQN
jgi:hypothetical protein